MFIPEAKPLTLFNIQLLCQKSFFQLRTSLPRAELNKETKFYTRLYREASTRGQTPYPF